MNQQGRNNFDFIPTSSNTNVLDPGAVSSNGESQPSYITWYRKALKYYRSLGGIGRFVFFVILFSFLGLTFKDLSVRIRDSSIVSSLKTKIYGDRSSSSSSSGSTNQDDIPRPNFVHEQPFITSTYYTSTLSRKTLEGSDKVLKYNQKNPRRKKEPKTRLAIVRPFCEFDAEALPTTFACWNSLPPCTTAVTDLGDVEDFNIMDADDEEDEDEDEDSNNNTTTKERKTKRNKRNKHIMEDAAADVFLFYSQTFANNKIAIQAVDSIIDTFNEPGGWSQCFENIYAIEANIPQELDLYIPSAQEELYNWVNGPNRQYEAAFRIIQSGDFGIYDGFYLMEGDSIPVKAYWLDKILQTVEENRPFAILGAKYNGDKWDKFYEKIPVSLLNHINGNAIYNTSHPLLERLVGQLEVEAPCPYNSIPYDYRMSQMITEGALGIVPKLAPKIMLNEDGENITLSDNTEMFKRWWDAYKEKSPIKETPIIHNYAATNLIPRHLGPEYVIHGAKLYSPWEPAIVEVTLVVSEWFKDRSRNLLEALDYTDHPFSHVIIMLPPDIPEYDEYDMTILDVKTQHRTAPDYMDLCEANVTTDWFMLTNAYHVVSPHTDMMFTPGNFKPVIPFTPATFPFCFKYAYCKETVNLAQRFNSGHDKVVLDFDMLYNTKIRNKFCAEWKKRHGDEGEDLYKLQKKRLMKRVSIIGPNGPTGTSYTAYLVDSGEDGMYKFTDRSLYGARDAFIKTLATEERLDGMSEEEMQLLSASEDNYTARVTAGTDCNCFAYQSEEDCDASGYGCQWRPLFDSCHPPELMDDATPICPETQAPTMAPTLALDGLAGDSVEPTAAPSKLPTDPEQNWFDKLFYTRESQSSSTTSGSTLPPDDLAVTPTATPSETNETKGRRRMTIIDDEYSNKPKTILQKMESQYRSSLQRPKGEIEIKVSSTTSSSNKNNAIIESDENKNLSPLQKMEQLYIQALSKNMTLEDLNITTDSDDNDETLNTASLLQKMESHFVTSIFSQRNISTVDVKRFFQNTPTNNRKQYQVEEHAKEKAINILNKDADNNNFKEIRKSSLPDTSARSNIDLQDRLQRMETQFQSSLSNSKSRRRLEVANNPIPTSSPSSHADDSMCPTWGPSIVPRQVKTHESPEKIHTHSKLPQNLAHHPMARKSKELRQQKIGHVGGIGPFLPNFFDENDQKNYIIPVDSNSMVHQPIRILFSTTEFPIDERWKHVLDMVSKTWSRTLLINPVTNPILPIQSTCGDVIIPMHHRTLGISNVDVVIYLKREDISLFCPSKAPIYSTSYVCNFDSVMRPIVASMSLCIPKSFQGNNHKSYFIRYISMEVGKILGLSTSFFPYYRNPITNELYGISKSKEVTCVDGTDTIIDVPNMLHLVEGNNKEESRNNDAIAYEITTPTVIQVIRNHFDCQILTGARLSHIETSSSCFGSYWNERFFFGEDWTPSDSSAISSDVDKEDDFITLSPLTLALLEDSSWYKGNYRNTITPSFGHGSGCGFVLGDCVTKDTAEISNYSKGYFCNSSSNIASRSNDVDPDNLNNSNSLDGKLSSCDYTHTYKGACDDVIARGGYPDVDYCPMISQQVISCTDSANAPSSYDEIEDVFGPTSKCFETTNNQNVIQSICLPSSCKNGSLQFFIEDQMYTCSYDGEILMTKNNNIQLICPRIAAVCPYSICPSNCAGKGICDYCNEEPSCICDNPLDLSSGCVSDE